MPRAKKKPDVDVVELDTSLPHAKAALDKFRAAKLRALTAVAEERVTKRGALKSLRSVYDRLLEDYLRADRSTTYQGWLDHGPKGEWDELVAALSDDAIWDRLVDTYERRNHAHAE